MKKCLIIMLGIMVSNAYAVKLDIKTTDLDKNDKITIHMSTVEGDCAVDPKGNYDHYKCFTSHDVSSFAFERFLAYISAINAIPSMADKKFVELSFDINGNAYPSCQHLEKIHGYQIIQATLSKTGCA